MEQGIGAGIVGVIVISVWLKHNSSISPEARFFGSLAFGVGLFLLFKPF